MGNSNVRAAPERDIEPLSTIWRYESAPDRCLAAWQALPALFGRNDRVGPGALGEALGGVGSPTGWRQGFEQASPSLSVSMNRIGSTERVSVVIAGGQELLATVRRWVDGVGSRTRSFGADDGSKWFIRC